MATDQQPKESQSSEQPAALSYPFNPAFPASPYPFFVYPAPQQSDSDGNSTVQTPQFMMIPPPGLFYFPTASTGQAFPVPAIPSTVGPTPSSSASTTTVAVAPPNRPGPKRKQVKTACTNCADSCKRCDESRPCERCLKLNIADSCKDSQRKERKKGFKRGPYKRKNKANPDPTPTESTASSSSSEWPPVTAQPGASPTVMPAVGQMAPEGIPIYYPPPFIAPTDAQPGSDGTSQSGHPPAPVPFFFPPFFPHSFNFVPPVAAGTTPLTDLSKGSTNAVTKGTSDANSSDNGQKRKQPGSSTVPDVRMEEK